MTTSRDYWDQIALEWLSRPKDGFWRAYSDFFYNHLLETWLKSHWGKQQPLLKTDLFDEAVSRGLFPEGAIYPVGIDLSFEVTRTARSRRPELLAIVGDVRTLPFKGGTFGTVISTSTLDHFSGEDQVLVALKELHRVLYPKGLLLLTMDNPCNPLLALRAHIAPVLMRLGIIPYAIGATLSPQRLRRALERLGFDLLELRPVLHCPRFLIIWLMRFLECIRPGYLSQRIEALFSLLSRFESLGRWPTRFLTGYYVLAVATKKEQDRHA